MASTAVMPRMGRVLALGAALLVLASHSQAVSEPKHVVCATTKGPIRINVYPEWAPVGAERFLQLVQSGFFTDVGMTRVVQGFLVQFGIAADPAVQREWNNKGSLRDDPLIGTPVRRGTMAYAGSGPNSRTTQMWIAFQDSTSLGTQPWETPFGHVLPEDMHIVDSFYNKYGDMAAFGGHGPDQGKQQLLGNAYLQQCCPELDYIQSCEVVASFRPRDVRASQAQVRPVEDTAAKANAPRARERRVGGDGGSVGVAAEATAAVVRPERAAVVRPEREAAGAGDGAADMDYVMLGLGGLGLAAALGLWRLRRHHAHRMHKPEEASL